MTKNDVMEIVKHYGKDRQKLKTIEELSELSEIVIKEINGKEIYPKDILGEIADVHIMLNQLILIYGFTDSAVSAEVDMKLKRTQQRMREGF